MNVVLYVIHPVLCLERKKGMFIKMNNLFESIDKPVEYTATPFSRDIKASDLFESLAYREALARLKVVVAKNYLGVLSGEVGTGKSTVIRKLVHSLDTMRYQPIYLTISGLKPRDFYGEVLRHMGEVPPYSIVKAKAMWERILDSRYEQRDKTVVLIIDEAQDLSEKMLLEIRFLINYKMDSIALFPVILVGQPELRRNLKLRKYESVAQRVQLQYHLGGLTPEETAGYIHHQMKTAGLSSPVFADSAIEMVQGISKGIPRVINHICAQVLYEANLKGREVIEETHIGRILSDMNYQRGAAG